MTDPLTDAYLDAIEQRANAATDGPWDYDGCGEISQHFSLPEPWATVVSTDVACMAYCYGGSAAGAERDEDAEFIAHARDDVPRLLAEVRRLQAADERVRALHHPVEIEPSGTICGECSYRMPNGRYLPVVEHPCPTIDALDGGE